MEEKTFYTKLEVDNLISALREELIREIESSKGKSNTQEMISEEEGE